MDPTERAEELDLWHAWKLATESIRALVAADIMAATGLSDPDFGVLTRVVELGRGRMRQNLLAESMGFPRGRLCHHLSRMEDRGLVIREPVSGGVDVVATASGAAAAAAGTGRRTPRRSAGTCSTRWPTVTRQSSARPWIGCPCAPDRAWRRQAR